MKKKSKIISALAVFAIILALVISVSSAEEAVTDEAGTKTDTHYSEQTEPELQHRESTEEKASPPSNGALTEEPTVGENSVQEPQPTDIPDNNVDTEDIPSENGTLDENKNTEGADTPSESTVFDEIYKAALVNADKILAALAFIGSVIVTFAYKKGLIPLISGAISAIKSTMDTIKEDGTKQAADTDKKIEKISDSLSAIAQNTEKADEAIAEIGNRLDVYDKAMAEHSSLRTILSSQIDMLYAIFTSSALPQYQKEEVALKIKAMREELAKYEKCSE